ncbi:hypothetical protein [[Acholeplasma] multilocale]|uniref:hypothetical protein n=1 Tax=[Acholeplasma] multilocale TaxID=264638 RepID=UPI000478951D|nr:hypothetical protein [[Acholeplasma] multilocale]
MSQNFKLGQVVEYNEQPQTIVGAGVRFDDENNRIETVKIENQKTKELVIVDADELWNVLAKKEEIKVSAAKTVTVEKVVVESVKVVDEETPIKEVVKQKVTVEKKVQVKKEIKVEVKETATEEIKSEKPTEPVEVKKVVEPKVKLTKTNNEPIIKHTPAPNAYKDAEEYDGLIGGASKLQKAKVYAINKNKRIKNTLELVNQEKVLSTPIKSEKTFNEDGVSQFKIGVVSKNTSENLKSTKAVDVIVEDEINDGFSAVKIDIEAYDTSIIFEETENKYFNDKTNTIVLNGKAFKNKEKYNTLKTMLAVQKRINKALVIMASLLLAAFMIFFMMKVLNQAFNFEGGLNNNFLIGPDKVFELDIDKLGSLIYNVDFAANIILVAIIPLIVMVILILLMKKSFSKNKFSKKINNI